MEVCSPTVTMKAKVIMMEVEIPIRRRIDVDAAACIAGDTVAVGVIPVQKINIFVSAELE